MTYDKTHDVLWLNADAHVRIGADAKGAGAADVRSGACRVRAGRKSASKFEQSVKVERPGQTIEADSAVGFLSEDEDQASGGRVAGHSRITTAKPAVGALESLTGRDMNLKCSADGQSLEHATITGQAGDTARRGVGSRAGRLPRRSSTSRWRRTDRRPVALTARDGVVLTFPAEADVPGRTITAATLDAKGEPDKGLTRAMFAGSVDFRERGPKLDRHATSATLDVGLKPGLSTIENARFRQKVEVRRRRHDRPCPRPRFTTSTTARSRSAGRIRAPKHRTWTTRAFRLMASPSTSPSAGRASRPPAHR